MRPRHRLPYSLRSPAACSTRYWAWPGVAVHGVEARVLAPCDGPPPEPWVSPLGASVPAAGTCSVAPIAPDPSAACAPSVFCGRTVRHRPSSRTPVPAPCLTALLFSDAPLVGTFHRAGEIAWYRPIRGPASLGGGPTEAALCRRPSLWPRPARALGGEYVCSGTASTSSWRRPPNHGRRRARRCCSSAARASKGPGCPGRSGRQARCRRPDLGDRRGPADRRPSGSHPGRPPFRVARHSGGEEKRRRCGALTSSLPPRYTARASAWCCWKAWPQGRPW